MPLNDLPPWLTGEQDKGFLQGAQLGISAARTGTEIAQTRQQMRERGELQPFRVAAAEIQNNLQRQQVDLNAATFVTKIRAGELENDVKAGLLTSTNLGISLKQLELQDSAIGERAQAEFIAGNREVSPIFKTAQAQSAWRLWKADTDYGHAKANEQAAAKTYETSLVNQAADQLKYGIDPYDYDWEGKRSSLPNVGKLQMGANVMEFKKREAAVRTASELSDITEGRQISIQNNRLEGRLEEIDARAEAIATSKIDVGMSSLNLAQWKEKARMLREEGKLNGDFTKYRNFVNSAGSNSAAITEPSQVSKLVADATEAYNQAYVDGKTKELPELKAKVTRAKVLELKAAGKVFDPDDQASWNKLEDGELVVFPANLTSNKAEERVDSVRQFSRKAAETMLAERAESLVTEIRKGEDARNSKKQSDARWLNFRPTGPF